VSNCGGGGTNQGRGKGYTKGLAVARKPNRTVNQAGGERSRLDAYLEEESLDYGEERKIVNKQFTNQTRKEKELHG